jgi:hypothetical protein
MLPEMSRIASLLSGLSDIRKSLHPVPLRKTTLQPKLRISQPGDRYEQEASRIADEIMNTSLQSTISPKFPAVNSHDQIFRKPSHNIDPVGSNATLEAFGVDNMEGAELSPSIRKEMEPKFNLDLGGVRIHTGRKAAEAAKSFAARAFTIGRNIYFGDQEYNPHTTDGKRLLAHELTHVVQQTIGSSDNSRPFGISSSAFETFSNISPDMEGRIARQPSGHIRSESVLDSADATDQKQYNLILLNPANDVESRHEGLTHDQAVELLKPLLDVGFEAFNKNREFVMKDRIKNQRTYESLYATNREIGRHSAKGKRALDGGQIEEAGNEIHGAMAQIVYFDKDVKFHNMTVGVTEQLPLLDRSPAGFNKSHVDLGGEIELDILNYVDGDTSMTYYKVPTVDVAVDLLKQHDMQYVFLMIKAARDNIDAVKKQFGETKGTKIMEQILFDARKAWQEGHNNILGKHGAVDLKYAVEEFNEAVAKIQMFDKGVIDYREKKTADAKFWQTVRDVVKIVIITVAAAASGGSAITIAVVMAGTEAAVQAAEIRAGVRPRFEAGEIILEGAKGAIHVPVITFRNNLVEALVGMGASRNFATKVGAHVAANYVAAKGNANIGGLVNIAAAKLMNQKVDLMTELDKQFLTLDLKHLTIEALALAIHPSGSHGRSSGKGTAQDPIKRSTAAKSRKSSDIESGTLQVRKRQEDYNAKREPSVMVDKEYRKEAIRKGMPVSKERSADVSRTSAGEGKPVSQLESVSAYEELAFRNGQAYEPFRTGYDRDGRGFIGITHKDLYLVRIIPPGAWGYGFFENKIDALKYARAIADSGPAWIKETTALPDFWKAAKPGDPLVEGTKVIDVGIFKVKANTPYKQGGIAPQPESNPSKAGKIYKGGGPQVLFKAKIEQIYSIPVRAEPVPNSLKDKVGSPRKPSVPTPARTESGEP